MSSNEKFILSYDVRRKSSYFRMSSNEKLILSYDVRTKSSYFRVSSNEKLISGFIRKMIVVPSAAQMIAPIMCMCSTQSEQRLANSLYPPFLAATDSARATVAGVRGRTQFAFSVRL